MLLPKDGRDDGRKKELDGQTGRRKGGRENGTDENERTGERTDVPVG